MFQAGLTAATVFWLVLAPTIARAQESAAAEPAPVEEAPSAIPVAEIALRADALEGRLREVSAQVSAGELEERFEADLASITAEIESAQTRLEQVEGRDRPGPFLDALSLVWERLNGQLTAETEQLGERAGQLDILREEIRESTERWRLTRDAARAAEAPQAVVDRVVEAVRTLLAADAELKAQRDIALDLQGRIAERQRSIEPAMERTAALRATVAASFLVRQHEPLWQGGFPLKGAGGEFSRLVSDLDEMGAEIVSYSRLQRGRLALQLLIMLALGWAFSRARGRRTQDLVQGETSAEQSGDPLRYPWTTALLFGLLLAFLLYPERPRGFQLLIALLALPLWLRVFRSLLPTALRGPMLGIAALALAELVRFAAAGFDLLVRNLLLLDLAVGFAGILWLRRPERVRHIPAGLGRGLWFRLLGGWLRLIGVAFGVGLVAATLGYTNLADRIALIAVWGTVIGAAWLAVVRTFEAVAESVIETGQLDFIHMVGAERQRFGVAVRRGLRGFAFVSWAYLLLTSAQLWSPLVAGLGGVLGARIGYGPIGLSVGSVLAFGLTLYLSWQLARFTSFALDHEVFSRVRLPPGADLALTTFTRYAIFVGGFVAALSILGFSWDRVSLLIGALGVGIGFGLQNVVNNVVSGIFMLFERPVRVGDRVQLDDLLGVVTTIGLRASKVRTFDGSDVLVPNGDFISARVINWTLSDERRRMTLPVRAAYGTKPRQVIELLEQLARGNPEVLDEPAPEALFRGFGESALDFELRAWTESERGFLAVMSDLGVAAGEALEAAGIRIPYPQQDLHLRNAPELGDALAGALRQGRTADPDETS